MRSCFTGREGIITREIVASHIYISPPLHFVLRLRLQKVGRICGTLRYSITQYRWVLRYSPCRIKQNLQQTDPAWESTVSMDKHHPLLQTRVSVTQLVRASYRHSEEPMAISSMSFSHTNPSLKTSDLHALTFTHTAFQYLFRCYQFFWSKIWCGKWSHIPR